MALIDLVKKELEDLEAQGEQVDLTIHRLCKELEAAREARQGLDAQIAQANAMLTAAEGKLPKPKRTPLPATPKKPASNGSGPRAITQTEIRDFMRQHPGREFTDEELRKEAFGLSGTSVPGGYVAARNALIEADIIKVSKRVVHPSGQGKAKAFYRYEPRTDNGPGNPPAPPDPVAEAAGGAARGGSVAGTGANSLLMAGLTKEFKKVIRPALQKGWWLVGSSNHPVLTNGSKRIAVSGSPSDVNAVHSLRRRLKREGVPLS